MKKTTSFLVVLVISLCLVFACKKIDLSTQEKEYFNVYNVGDIMKFQLLPNGYTNTYVITKKDLLYGAGPVGRSRQSSIEYSKNNQSNELLLLVTQDRDGANSNMVLFDEFYADLNNDFGSVNQQDTIKFLNKKITNYYEINSNSIGTITDSTIVKVYWQKKYGIVRYILKNGASFGRINIPSIIN
jgi:hypothetical protein